MASDDGPSKAIPRHELIAVALDLGIDKPELLSEEELSRSIQQTSEGHALPAPVSGPLGKGWFGVARNLVASVLEKGLNLPTAARVLRETVRSVPPQRPPYPTVTLAQIYMAQGHNERAAATLQQVLRRDPSNPKAKRLQAQLPVAEPSLDSVHQGAEPDTSAARSVSPQAEAGAVPLRDSLVVLRQKRTALVYWEISEASRRKLQLDDGLEVRLTLVTPSERGASISSPIWKITREQQHQVLECEPEVVVRAAIGLFRAGNFLPLCVASTFRVAPGGACALEFAPRKGQSDHETAARASRLLPGG
jgi:hypothetical protein